MQALLLRFLENGEIQAVGADHAQTAGRRARHRRHQPQPRRAWCPPASSARTCSTGCASSTSTCRRCASAARTSARSCASWSSKSAARPVEFRRGRAQAARALSLAGQRPRAAERRRAGDVVAERQTRRRGAPAAVGAGRPATCCCRRASAAGRSPTSSTRRWYRAATRSGSTSTRCSCRATSRGTTCASWCAAGCATTRGNYRALLRLFGMPHARLQAVPQFPGGPRLQGGLPRVPPRQPAGRCARRGCCRRLRPTAPFLRRPRGRATLITRRPERFRSAEHIADPNLR